MKIPSLVVFAVLLMSLGLISACAVPNNGAADGKGDADVGIIDQVTQPHTPDVVAQPPVTTAPSQAHDVVLSRKEFSPSQMSIAKGKEFVISVSDPEKFHLISCYNSKGQRVSTTQNLNDGEFTTLSFKDAGQYLCVDAIFGARLTVDVKDTNSAIIGNAILGVDSADAQTPIVFLIALAVAIGIFIYIGRSKSSPAKNARRQRH